jgi:hypothetical protein
MSNICSYNDQQEAKTFKSLYNLYWCVHTYKYIPLTLYRQRGNRGIWYSSETPTFYQNYLAMRNTVDVTGGELNAIWSQSVSGVSAINHLGATDK